jgi:hypothetical protein
VKGVTKSSTICDECNFLLGFSSLPPRILLIASSLPPRFVLFGSSGAGETKRRNQGSIEEAKRQQRKTALEVLRGKLYLVPTTLLNVLEIKWGIIIQ